MKTTCDCTNQPHKHGGKRNTDTKSRAIGCDLHTVLGQKNYAVATELKQEVLIETD